MFKETFLSSFLQPHATLCTMFTYHNSQLKVFSRLYSSSDKRTMKYWKVKYSIKVALRLGLTIFPISMISSSHCYSSLTQKEQTHCKMKSSVYDYIVKEMPVQTENDRFFTYSRGHDTHNYRNE